MAVTLTNWIDADRRVFDHKKKYIHGAIEGDTGIIDGVTNDNKEDIFYMMLFCLCVPQSKAVTADEAIDLLRELDYYHIKLPKERVLEALKGRVRFQLVKTQRLIDARSLIQDTDFWLHLKTHYADYTNEPNKLQRQVQLKKVRRYLTSQVNGMGMKLASHFLRNVGMSGLAILDVHVLDGLKKRGIIPDEEITLNYGQYVEIEEKMIEYAKTVGITVDELDFLLWSQKTGYVFK